MSIWKSGVIVGLGFWIAVPHSKAEMAEESPHVWQPRVESVTVFKNGLGFFQRTGAVKLRDGWCTADAVPPACFGALSIYAHNKDELVDIVGSGPGEVIEFDGIDASDDPKQIKSALESYERMKVQLSYYQDGEDRVAAGQLVSVAADYVVLKNETQYFAVPVSGVKRLQVLGKPLRMHVESENSDGNQETMLGMAYLREGITWVPEYTLKLIDDKTAELTLRGTLINEAEDLVHCDVNFVVGVPHFMHTKKLAPIAIGQTIRTIGAAVSSSAISSQMINSAIYSNIQRSPQNNVVHTSVATDAGNLNSLMGNLPSWEGAGTSDFKVYTRKDLTLRRGEKAIVTLFVKRIRYDHIYRWSPPGDIQHLLSLKNDTDTPWTTGPCLALSDGNPLSEDLLKYVPQGGTGELPVTTAVNVVQKQEEVEADRKLRAYCPNQTYMDLVTLSGKLSIRNYDKLPTRLVVDLELKGKPLEASDSGEIVHDTKQLRLMERGGSVHWSFELEPGEEKILNYSYERYVPSQ